KHWTSRIPRTNRCTASPLRNDKRMLLSFTRTLPDALPTILEWQSDLSATHRRDAAPPVHVHRRLQSQRLALCWHPRLFHGDASPAQRPLCCTRPQEKASQEAASSWSPAL